MTTGPATQVPPPLDPDLIAAFERRYPAYWEPHPPPTDESIARICAYFGTPLPIQLIQLARATTHFSSLFLSLGPDEDADNHIIAYNHYWRRRRRSRRLPATHIILNNGFMDDDFWCLLKHEAASAGDIAAVQFWSPAPAGYPQETIHGERYDDFPSFLRAICELQA
jgi:hypothetical protein